jgi:hypothetical protein
LTAPGRVRAKASARAAPPARGRMKTYLLTSAQNNTGLHVKCWSNLLALAAYTRAEILVSPFTYDVESRAAAGEKRAGKPRGRIDAEWDPGIVPYLSSRRVQLAPGLAWCGELQILPTATNPLSGLESYSGRDSSVVPHVKFAVVSVASPKNAGAKFMFTTGAVTLRNYIQKKAGQKAEFHHGYGALLVEVDSDGAWFARQINADSAGVIYDLDRRVSGGAVTGGHRPEAIVWGDIHVRQLEPEVRQSHWGPGGILDTLRPRRQAFHDVLDFRSQNHHDRDDPWRTYEKHAAGGLGVEAELTEAAAFLAGAGRTWCESIVVRSNHDEALVRWLKECDFKLDPLNAEFLLEATLAKYRGGPAFDPIAWAFRRSGPALRRVRFLKRDEDFVLCPDANGGIEIGMHGDRGANGARGSLLSFARSGRKSITGHTHAAGLYEGAMSVGVTAALDQGYNEGQSSWSRTHAIVYPNGKRTLLTVYRGRWRGCSGLKTHA